MARGRYRGEIETTVYVAVCDILEELTDDDLVTELTERGLGNASISCPIAATEARDSDTVYRGWAEELRTTAKRGDWVHFEVLLMRMAPLPPKKVKALA